MRTQNKPSYKDMDSFIKKILSQDANIQIAMLCAVQWNKNKKVEQKSKLSP